MLFVCLYIWLKPSNRTHSLEKGNFWMWTNSRLALPPSPQPRRWETYNSLCSKDLRAPSWSACRVLDSTQAVQPETRSLPFCFSWTTGGFICLLFICSHIHLTDTDYYEPGNVLNEHSLMVIKYNLGVTRPAMDKVRQL